MEEHDVTVNVNLTKLSSFLLSSVAMTSKSETSGAIQSVDQEGYTQTFTMVNNECGNTNSGSGRLHPDIYMVNNECGNGHEVLY